MNTVTFCFQIRDLHIAKDEEDIGFYAGFVGEFSTDGTCVFSSIDLCNQHEWKSNILYTGACLFFLTIVVHLRCL
jgi:fluoride ion exporter CrcB/FEX